MEKYEVTFEVPYWSTGGMPRTSTCSDVFEAKGDQEAIDAIPELLPKAGITVRVPGGNSYELTAEPKKLVKIVRIWK